MVIHQVVVEILTSGPKRLTDHQQTDWKKILKLNALFHSIFEIIVIAKIFVIEENCVASMHLSQCSWLELKNRRVGTYYSLPQCLFKSYH